MIVNRNFILSKLPRYQAQWEMLQDEQDVDDIMKGMQKVHNEFAKDYDKIAYFFVGETVVQTCENIFNFLRRETKYSIESDLHQTVRSPSAIVATGKRLGIDCKNYALFAGGVLDAINRLGLQKINYCYRFVSDDMMNQAPCHVFVVVNPGGDEIWIDPIPQVENFNSHWTYYYPQDNSGFLSLL